MKKMKWIMIKNMDDLHFESVNFFKNDLIKFF